MRENLFQYSTSCTSVNQIEANISQLGGQFAIKIAKIYLIQIFKIYTQKSVRIFNLI